MKTYVLCLCSMSILCLAAPVFQDGVLIAMEEQQIPVARQFLVVDSFPAGATDYSMGLACDGEYIWNDETFLHWFARMDTATGAVINTFNTTTGNRDMTFDGEYLWASDWNAATISKFDTATCTVVNTYAPPFYAGKPHGMAWDGTHLWVGEESGRIYQMTLTGDTVRSIPPPVYYSYDPRGLAFDGTALWVGYQSSGLIYKVDTANGAVLETFSAPGAVPGQRFQQGLACDGEFLWSTVGGLVQMIYQIDIGLVGIRDHREMPISSPLLSIERNPFERQAIIHVVIARSEMVRMCVVDVTGRVVAVLNDGLLPPGHYTYSWGGNHTNSGVYYVLLESAAGSATRKLVKIK